MKDVEDDVDTRDICECSSCSAFVALRIHTVLPISVIGVETWLAAASSKLTGDIPWLWA
jgi:hypothetical protein